MVNCFPDQHGRSLLKQMDPFGTENKFSNVTQSLFEIITKMKQIQDVLFCSSSNLSIALNGDTVSGKDSTRIASEDTQSNSNLDEEKLWRQLEKRNIQLHSFRLKVLGYWDRKVREATGKIYDQTNKFKVINQTVPNQIQGVSIH